MYIREVLVHFGFQVTSNLILDSAAVRGICKREGVGRVTRLSCKVLWVQQLVKRGVLLVGSTPGLENKADLGAKSLPVARLRYLRERCGLTVTEETVALEEHMDAKPKETDVVQAITTAGRSGSGGGLLQAIIGLLAAVKASGGRADSTALCVMSGGPPASLTASILGVRRRSR